MKGTGFGTFEATVVVRVADQDKRAIQAKTGVAPERRDGDETHAYFILPLTITRPGDDETILFELGHLLGDAIDWQVNWAESEY